MCEYRVGPAEFVSGPTFVPRPDGRSEDDGYLLVTVLNGAGEGDDGEGGGAHTRLDVLDAMDLGKGPLCSILLESYLPHSLYGSLFFLCIFLIFFSRVLPAPLCPSCLVLSCAHACTLSPPLSPSLPLSLFPSLPPPLSLSLCHPTEQTHLLLFVSSFLSPSSSFPLPSSPYQPPNPGPSILRDLSLHRLLHS